MDSLQWIEHFHLIRPFWLLALIPLALIIWLYAHTQSQNHNWASVVDSRLLKHLIQGHVQSHKKPTPVIGLFSLGCIIIFALAGPAFEKRPQPIFKNQAALIIILDLSRSMDSTDIKPNRLNRAHFKINDILASRKEGQTALIAYAANAYVVSPLTDDAGTIASQVPALETAIMPSQGSRLDIALDKALQLFRNAGHAKGDILVITDSINARDKKKIKILSEINYSTSILAVGTAEGAPIANANGGFVKDKKGKIVVPQLNAKNMREAALIGGGRFSLITATDDDINYLVSSIDSQFNSSKENNQQQDKDAPKFKTDLWHEEGPWLILLIIPFAAYAFRKGLIFIFIIFILPLPQPAQAFEWSDMWQNKDQRGESALTQGDAEHAAQLFKHPEWKAAAQYKAGKYKESAELLKDIDTPEANYNRGNALAKSGNIEDAKKAYDRSLELDPNHKDAQFNKKLLEQSEENQSNKANSGGDSSDKKDEKNKDDKKKEKEKQEKENKDEKSKDGDSKNDDPQDGESNDGESKDNKSEENQDQKEQKDKDSSDKKEQNKDSEKGDKSDEEQSKQNDAESEPNDDTQKGKNSESEENNDEALKNQPKDEKLNEEKQKNAAETDKKEEPYQPQQKDAKEQKNSDKTDDKLTPNLKYQQTQQWLKKIPDDPGGLLRRKFKYQYGQQKNRDESTPW
ncbi:Aerotolerance protein BatB / Aerotolerance protein BatC [hydrothermal vent metagenome]|uniref:Aerotolerance protein BatB / Aerotolerance protein BatC n=1 Tax=hydrothermal vent metagenome TaxID=652676 RepID=A0A3B0X7Q1_9ZZZZ